MTSGCASGKLQTSGKHERQDEHGLVLVRLRCRHLSCSSAQLRTRRVAAEGKAPTARRLDQSNKRSRMNERDATPKGERPSRGLP